MKESQENKQEQSKLNHTSTKENIQRQLFTSARENQSRSSQIQAQQQSQSENTQSIEYIDRDTLQYEVDRSLFYARTDKDPEERQRFQERAEYFQAKLNVSHPQDEQELEADRVSEQVMRMQDVNIEKSNSNDYVPRREQPGRLSPGRATPSIPLYIETRILRERDNGGSPLSDSSKDFFEPRFNADLSNIRIHNNSESNDLSKNINAKAFTMGNDIFFAPGQYDEQSSEGKKLMAHELTHTIQQKGKIGRKVMRKGTDTLTGYTGEEERTSTKKLTVKSATYNKESKELKLNYNQKGDKIIKFLGIRDNTHVDKGGDFVFIFEISMNQHPPQEKIRFSYIDKRDLDISEDIDRVFFIKNSNSTYLMYVYTYSPYEVKYKKRSEDTVTFQVKENKEIGISYLDVIEKAKKNKKEANFKYFSSNKFIREFRKKVFERLEELFQKTLDLIEEDRNTLYEEGDIDVLISLVKNKYGQMYRAGDMLRLRVLNQFINSNDFKIQIFRSRGVPFELARFFGEISTSGNDKKIINKILPKYKPSIVKEFIAYSLSAGGYNGNIKQYIDQKCESLLHADILDFLTSKYQRSDNKGKFNILTDIHTDFRSLSAKSDDEIKEYVQKTLKEREKNTQETRKRLKENPNLLWELSFFVHKVMEDYGLKKDNKYGKLISNELKKAQAQKTFTSFFLGAVGIGLAAMGFFTAGTTWAAATTIGVSTAVNVYDLYREVENYRFHDKASKAAFSEKLTASPSFWGVFFAIFGLVIDGVDLVKSMGVILKASKKLDLVKDSQKFMEKAGEVFDELNGLKILKISNKDEFLKLLKKGLDQFPTAFLNLQKSPAIFKAFAENPTAFTKFLDSGGSAAVQFLKKSANKLREDLLNTIIKKGHKNLEVLNYLDKSAGKFLNSLSKDELNLFFNLYESSYLKILSPTMKKRYLDILNDAINKNLGSKSLLERLTVLDRASDLKLSLIEDLGEAASKINLGSRNIAFGNINIEFKGEKILVEDFISVSGKGNSDRIAQALKLKEKKYGDYKVIPEIDQAKQKFTANISKMKNDAEKKIVEYILDLIEKKLGRKINKWERLEGFKGYIKLNSEMQPCESCLNIISKQFKKYFGNDIKIILSYGTNFRKVR